MRFRRPPWRLFVGSALLVAAAFAVSFWFVRQEQERLYNEELTDQLLAEARVAREALREDWPEVSAGRLAALLHTLQGDGVDVAVVAADGRTLLDSVRGRSVAELLGSPEVQRALLVGSGARSRPWGPEGRPHVMVAVRVGSDDSTLGVVWLARPTWSFAADRRSVARLLGAAACIAALIGLVLAAVLARMRRRLVRRLIAGTRSLSTGDLSANLEISGWDDLATLSSSLKILRRRLAWQVETIQKHRRTLEALVQQLGEGVIVARADGRIALINAAAVRLLNLRLGPAGAEGLIGQPVEAWIPQHALQRLLLARPGGEEMEQLLRLEVETPGGRMYLVARAADLVVPEPNGETEAAAAGRVLMLTDITELQRTIHLRTDFVSNASHELRTPLSTIRAAVETLLGMDLQAEAQAARPFVQAIERHSARLERLVADLLDLSRLESPAARFEPQTLDLRRVLQELEARFADSLERQRLHWHVVCEPAEAQHVVANSHLLQLVLDNLVDNAIKFTDPGGHVSVRVRKEDARAQIEVVDDGCGIPPDEQERVFERFYQVQRGRSGAERGTGLGLSIVRHAVGAMHGNVRLDSAPGRGTCVTVTIPQPKP